MESSVQRRIESITQHLIPNKPLILLLQQAQLNGVLQEERKRGGEAVIIGGMVLDIQAVPSLPTNPGTTAPGQVYYALGGVARNVGECMSKLGSMPFMISTLGLDMAGNLLLEHWTSAGLPIKGILRNKYIQTPVVSCILDRKGEVAAAVASVEAVEKYVTPEWIQQFRSDIHSAPILLVDANLDPCALEVSCRIAAEYNVPVWFEPVSVAKSRRISSVVRYITFASPNEDELVAMANSLSDGNLFHPLERNRKYSVDQLFQKLKPAIWFMLERGIKILVLTIGSDGVILCSKGTPDLKIPSKECKPNQFSSQLYKTVSLACPAKRHSGDSKPANNAPLFALHFPSLTASVVRLTGAGDCLVGGMLASLCTGLDIMQSVSVGVAAAKASVEANTNVPSAFSTTKVAVDAGSVYSAAKVLFSGV